MDSGLIIVRFTVQTLKQSVDGLYFVHCYSTVIIPIRFPLRGRSSFHKKN